MSLRSLAAPAAAQSSPSMNVLNLHLGGVGLLEVPPQALFQPPPPLSRDDCVRDGLGRADIRLGEAIRQAAGKSPHTPRFHTQVLMGVPTIDIREDIVESGGEQLRALMTIIAACLKKVFGQDSRVAILPLDDLPSGRVVFYFGALCQVPSATSPGAMLRVGHPGAMREMWALCPAPDPHTPLVKRPLLTASQRKVLITAELDQGPVAVGGDDWNSKLFIDLESGTAFDLESGTPHQAHIVAPGLRRWEIPNGPVIEIEAAPTDPHLAETAAPQPSPSPPRPRCSPLVALLRLKPGHRAAPRREPTLTAVAEAPFPIMVEEQVLVPTDCLPGSEQPTLATGYRRAAITETVARNDHAYALHLEALALPRIDQVVLNGPEIRGYCIGLRAGAGLGGDGDCCDMTLGASPDSDRLFWVRDQKQEWREAPVGADGGFILDLPTGFSLTPPPLPEHYHAMLSLPPQEKRTITVKDGAPRTFGRGRTDAADRVGLPSTVPNAFMVAKGGHLPLDQVLSQNHLVLWKAFGQLHVRLSAGRTPAWKLPMDGGVPVELGADSEELILSDAELLLVGPYLLRVRMGSDD